MNKTKSAGLERFNYWLSQLEGIFDKADGSNDPALTIFEENIRTPFFMLEALSRVYARVYGKKPFKKLDNYFKEMEDSLGVIDYYDGFYKESITKKYLPASVSAYLKEEKEANLKKLNDQMELEEWTTNNRKRISKISKRLTKVKWLPETEETMEVKKVYRKYITAITDAFRKNKIQYNAIESDVHELRRELRWLSIYPQAFRGLFQLKSSTETPGQLKKYLTNEIITSPYNKMPDGSNLLDHILLNSDNFYALSWMISELGKLKDEGLRIIVLTEALQKLFNITNTQATELAYAIAGESQVSIPDILDRAKSISQTFFSENILDGMMN